MGSATFLFLYLLLNALVFAKKGPALRDAGVLRGASKTWPEHPPTCWSKDSGHGGDDCLWKNNPKPGVVPNITTYTGDPVFVKQVKNGKLYRGGSGDDSFNIVHLWSSNSTGDNYFEMGEAYGQLLATEFGTMFLRLEPWLIATIERVVPWLPKWLADLAIDEGLVFVLDVLKDIVKKNIPTRYYQEWQGIEAGCKSVGIKCTVDDIARVSLFAQLSKAACTAFVANDEATVRGSPMHLRCLDFDASSHVSDFATLTVYHYNTMPQYANFGYSAMTDCLSCSNSLHLSIGEKMWGGHNSLVPSGLPWQMMLRESMEYSSLADVKKFITSKSIAPPGDNPVWPGGDINMSRSMLPLLMVPPTRSLVPPLATTTQSGKIGTRTTQPQLIRISRTSSTGPRIPLPAPCAQPT